MADSWFSGVSAAPPIEVFAIGAKCTEDSFPQKVNLGAGVYKTNECKPWVLPVVKSVESQMAADPTLNHEYLPVAGLPDYRSAAAKLLLGATSAPVLENRVGAIQACGGTGALRVGMAFLRKVLKSDTVYVSEPTWGNHRGIAMDLGFPNIRKYTYWDQAARQIDFKSFCYDLQNAPPKSVIILHMCAHNPTGMDPTMEQWVELARIIKEKQLFPFFDCAYQGFASGNLENDAASLKYFIDQGFELFAAQSFSKNFGLYNERVGNLVYVVKNPASLAPIQSQMEILVRVMWSNPPAHGARIIATVLNNPSLLNEWKENVATMANRILDMRRQLYERLRALGTPGTWTHITTQAGMFSYTGLSERQSVYLTDKHHIYLLKSGRINMCGLTTANIDYVANAIHDAIVNVREDPKL